MSFTKAELQSLRSLLTKEINVLRDEVVVSSAVRRQYYDHADKQDPVSTAMFYRLAKTESNRLDATKKKLKKKEALLRTVKAENKKEDSYTTLINLDVDLNFGLLDKFFAFVRGTK